MQGSMGMEAAYEKGFAPLREFMVRQTREQDLALMVELSKAKPPASMADIGNVQLIPAVALPLKVLMFVLVDGWSLVLKALVGSFH